MTHKGLATLELLSVESAVLNVISLDEIMTQFAAVKVANVLELLKCREQI